MNIFRIFRRKPSQADRILQASLWIDEDRKKRVAALKASRSRAAKQGWETRRAGL